MKTARINWKLTGLFTAFAICGMSASTARAALIVHWNFNDGSSIAALTAPAEAGMGSIDVTQFDAGTVVSFTGTTLNAVPPDPAGLAIAINGGSALINNGKAMIIHVVTTGHTGIGMSFATQRTSTGFGHPTDTPANQVQYWDPGDMSWHDANPAQYSIVEVSTMVYRAFDFTGITAVENKADAQIRIIFNGATTSNGNNRIDNLQFIDNASTTLTGACCLPTGGQCQQYTSAACTAATGTYGGAGSVCSPNPCQSVPGACCTGTSCAQTLRSACQGAGMIFLGENVSCTGACAPNYTGLKINEIRTQQPGADDDEFFEIYNDSATTKTLNGLTYIVIGDDLDTPQPSNSGFIENVTDLSGFSIPSHGHFLVAERPIIFDHAGVPLLNAHPNLVATLNFEDSDNLTHMLVSGFYGTNGQDLDTPDNCVLDASLPWSTIIDRVAFAQESNPPVTTECTYGLNGVPPNTIGPDGVFVPAHASRIPDGSTASNAWVYINEFDPLQGNDTPGTTNVLATGACCAGSFCAVETRQDCVEVDEGIWKGRDTVCGTGGNGICQGACCYCTSPTPWCGAWSCTITDAQTCANNFGGTFQGEGSVCLPNPGGVDCTTCLTIAQARALFYSTDPPVPIGVRLCGVRLSSKTDLIGLGSSTFEIQDTSGTDGQTAFTVFGQDSTVMTPQFGSLSEGAKIDIQGTLQLFNGILELVNSSTKALALVHDYGPPLVVPPPIVIPGSDFQDQNPIAENRESEVVKINCAIFINPPDGECTSPNTPPCFTENTNYDVTDGTNIFTVRIVAAIPPLDLVGTPIPSGPCSITGIFSQGDGAAPFDSNYRLLPRKLADIGAGTCGPTKACCVGGGTCRADLPQTLCEGLGGNFFPGQTTCTPTPPCLTADSVRINEIRTDQPSTDYDEYFELRGTPTTPLATLTYIVIGDNGSGSSGVIESVTPLTGVKIPADGIFLAARTTYSLGGTPDLVTDTIGFENDDNMTHLLVENFTGALGDDLDTPDDGVLDSTPWSRVLDSVAIIKEFNPPTISEWYYTNTTVGPAGDTSPSHVLRCPPSDAWVPGTEDTNVNGGNDTPGAVNPNVCPCACPADRNADGKVNGKDVSNFAKVILGQIAMDPCADINQDGVVNYNDTAPFVDLVLQGQSCSGDFATGVRIVSYNLLQYNGGASADRKTAFKRVMNNIRPDVLAAQELSGGGATDFLNNVLNAADGPGGYALASYTGGDEAIYYRTAKITYAAVPVDGTDFGSVDTLPRATPWRLFGVTGGNPANNFYIYDAHLKAGQFADDNSDPSQRDAEAVLIRADADTRNGAQVIIAGDFNLYNSNINDTINTPNNPPETAWGKLTAAGDVDGQMIDPIATPGIWHAQASFAGVHTQSPHLNNNTLASPAPPGAIGGGMDDRFDFVLVNAKLTDSVGLSYLAGTYKAFGNDGLHFNNDINDPPTIPQGSIIADALHAAADHIPVVMELKINP
jgi:endonuclease/exonuclease/phosphatase family metal-dependent hydrolase